VSQALPILPFRDKIVAELERAGALILGAPTGSGKSTQTPQFLLGKIPGKILVLQPRRLSARSLAARVASETGTALGTTVGYQVRFDSRCGAETKIIFQTYGVFIAQMLKDPSLPGVGAVLLDEFHERTLECDLALAWLKTSKTKIVVMSATLDMEKVKAYLPGAAHVEVPGRLFPVEIRHRPGEALQALEDLTKEGLNGSVLIFMPGLREIRRTITALGPHCRAHGLELLALHGSMDMAEQQRALEVPDKPRVIVATNVAETGLTIPRVTLVIDSGLHRVAAYDAARGINTLYLSRISRGNADQRSGRAGRTAPGRCVRLWSKADEAHMAAGLKPEITRLELSSLYLEAASLPKSVDWVTAPPEAAWAAARKSLENLAAIDAEGRVTARGRALLRYPASPRLAAVLEAARGMGPSQYDRACRMAAVFETAGDRRPDRAENLSEIELEGEAVAVYQQFKRMAGTEMTEGGSLELAWLEAFSDRLAMRDGDGFFYRLPDGRGALLPAMKDPPPLILALDIRERAGGGQSRQVGVTLYLPFDPETIRRSFPAECVWARASEFDERKQRVINEERLIFRGLILARKEARGNTSELWAEKFASGELEHPGMDDRANQLVVRILLARKLYPDLGFPEMTADDWRLIYGEAFAGRNALKDIERVNLIPHIEGYLGRPLADALDRFLPSSRKLPSGKSGRFIYHESQPAELAARLGDFVKMTGTLALCEGRLPVTFDILAPNHRTVQKTRDLASFWANTYPTVKKELQRRYPRHPWP
jgi:ATP-dependent helicase HrpB